MPLGCKEHERLWSDLACAIRSLVSASGRASRCVKGPWQAAIALRASIARGRNRVDESAEVLHRACHRTWLLKLVDPWIKERMQLRSNHGMVESFEGREG
jgi:hypothetical protein